MADQADVDGRSESSAEPDGHDEAETNRGKRPAASYVAKRTVRKFLADGCTDLAAALTYFAVLALFPALVALVALPALVGRADETRDALFDIVDQVVPSDLAASLRGPIEQLTQVPGVGVALVIGLAGALWAASNYVGAFARATNRIYAVEEGRPFWKLRPIMLLVTVVMLVLVAVAAVLLVVTGPLAREIGSAVGLGDTAVTVWNIAKWPALVVVILVVIAILYYATPNVRQPRFRWISLGAVVALVIWALASAGFGFYVANFANYDRMYGSLAGIIIFLLWLWITNLALLFGAELNAEIERARELEAGVAAEENVQLPPRDTKKSDKAAEKAAKDVREARALREDSGGRAGT